MASRVQKGRAPLHPPGNCHSGCNHIRRPRPRAGLHRFVPAPLPSGPCSATSTNSAASRPTGRCVMLCPRFYFKYHHRVHARSIGRLRRLPNREPTTVQLSAKAEVASWGLSSRRCANSPLRQQTHGLLAPWGLQGRSISEKPTSRSCGSLPDLQTIRRAPDAKRGIPRRGRAC